MYSYMETKNDAFTDFYMLFCGMQECPSLYSFGPAVREYLLLHYCISGKGFYYLRNKRYEIQAGDAFLILPNEVTFYQADEQEPWTYLWIGFDGSKASLYLKRCGLDKEHLITHCDQSEQLVTIIQDIMAHTTLSYSNELYNQGKLFEFFSYLAQSAHIEYRTEISSENIHVSKTIEFIQKNFQNMITVNEMADYVGLHRSYLSTIFQQQIHMSPQQFLMKFRITKAMTMLIDTEYPINSISYSCGYANQLAFSKAFHKIAGMSPSNYRKEKRMEKNTIRTKDPHEDDKL